MTFFEYRCRGDYPIVSVMNVVERLDLAIEGLDKGEPAGKVKGLRLTLSKEIEEHAHCAEEVFNLRKRNAELELENAKLKQAAQPVAVSIRNRKVTSETLGGMQAFGGRIASE